MNKFDKNLYEFLVKEENFHPFVSAIGQYENVKLQLLQEFWGLVKNKLEERNKTSWKVEADKTIPHGTSKICMYTDDYSVNNFQDALCMLTFEKLNEAVIYGLWINRDQVSDINFKQIAAGIGPAFTGWKAGSGGWWFAAMKETGDNFKYAHELVKIIPSTRDSLADHYANLLTSALQQFSTFIELNKGLLSK